MNKNHVPKGLPGAGQFARKDQVYTNKMVNAVRKYSDTPAEDMASMGIGKPSISDFFMRVKNGQAKDSETFELGEITERARKDIERLTGQKLNATKHVISATELAHIIIRHGESGQADHTMSKPKDFENLAQVLKNYDSIELSKKKSKFRNGQGENAPIILYHKKLNADTQIIAEAVTDGKKGKLRIVAAYKSNVEK